MRPLDLANHPCFNQDRAACSGRVHLPVATRCNIQCGYCNRRYDCVNESRPGVTSGVLSPPQALAYLKEVMARNPSIGVVGIAGPGDPFANAEETLETLRLVREAYPEMLLCVSTNGLNLMPYLPELALLEVTHVTVTVNTLRVGTAESVYSWMRIGKRLRRPPDRPERPERPGRQGRATPPSRGAEAPQGRGAGSRPRERSPGAARTRRSEAPSPPGRGHPS